VTPALFAILIVCVGGVFAYALHRAGQRASGADWGRGWLSRMDGLTRIFCRRWHRLQADPLALPASGPAVVVANHVSGLDPLLLVTASPRPLRFIIAREQYRRPLLHGFFRAIGSIPVDRTGRPERAFREALRALEAGEVVALFPQGTIHLDTEPPRRLKPGAARLARMAGCDIYPARIEGVAGQGHVLPALFLRGRARVKAGERIACASLSEEECLERITAAIAPSAADRPPSTP
jgi:1-acyl-sn-glycerol-3-phosphate acyltransferase